MIRGDWLQFGRGRRHGDGGQSSTANLCLKILEEAAEVQLADASNGVEVRRAAVVLGQVPAQRFVDVGAASTKEM